MKLSLVMIGLLCYSLIPGALALAQEDSWEQTYDSMIDSIVEDAFTRFDDRYNTFIFSDEPYVCEDEDDEMFFDDKKHSRKSRLSRKSLYVERADSRLNVGTGITYPWELHNDNLIVRYNRVESVFLGFGIPNRYTWDRRSVSLFGSGGYGFASHRWRYNGGLAQQFGMGRTMIELGVEGHSLTDSKDQWIVEEGENSMAAFFLRDDYRDYFGREGVSGWLGFYGKWKNTDLQFRTAYLNDRYNSLPWRTNWSVFGGDKLFRTNPDVNEGRMKSLLATFEIHNEYQRTYFTAGWKAALSAEFAGKGLGGDFGFNRYIVDVTRYQPLSKFESLNLRAHVGSATGDVPLQKSFDIGGISTLPAFTYKEFSGNRVLLGNVEYMLNGKIFDDVDLFPSWLLRNFNLIAFYDAGYVTTVPTDARIENGFSDATLKNLKSDWGVGIGTRDARIRLGFAWRTDISEPVHVFLRLNRPF